MQEVVARSMDSNCNTNYVDLLTYGVVIKYIWPTGIIGREWCDKHFNASLLAFQGRFGIYIFGNQCFTPRSTTFLAGQNVRLHKQHKLQISLGV